MERLVELGEQISNATQRFGSGMPAPPQQTAELFDAEAMEQVGQPHTEAGVESPDGETSVRATAGSGSAP
jgi:hypothetical protein